MTSEPSIRVEAQCGHARESYMQITIFVNIVSDRDVCTLLWFLLMLLARSRAWPWDGRTLRLMLAFVVSVKRCNGFRQVCFSLRLIFLTRRFISQSTRAASGVLTQRVWFLT